MAAHLLGRTEGSVRYLTLNNVAKANSLSQSMQDGLLAAIADADQDPLVNAIVLTANGKFFCTGMDFSVGAGAAAKVSRELHEKRYEQTANLFDTVGTCSKPTIALVNGSCYGGGNGLAFACDIRIVVDHAEFVLSEVRRGLSPATISRYIVREWGTSLSREAMITGRKVTAMELKAIHAVHHVCGSIEEGHQKLQTVLADLNACAPRAVGQSKRLVNAVYESDRKESASIIKDIFMDMTRPSDEAAYGIAQFQSGVRKVDWPAWYKAKQSSHL